jgi:hypothetical protein
VGQDFIGSVVIDDENGERRTRLVFKQYTADMVRRLSVKRAPLA